MITFTKVTHTSFVLFLHVVTVISAKNVYTHLGEISGLVEAGHVVLHSADQYGQTLLDTAKGDYDDPMQSSGLYVVVENTNGTVVRKNVYQILQKHFEDKTHLTGTMGCGITCLLALAKTHPNYWEIARKYEDRHKDDDRYWSDYTKRWGTDDYVWNKLLIDTWGRQKMDPILCDAVMKTVRKATGAEFKVFHKGLPSFQFQLGTLPLGIALLINQDKTGLFDGLKAKIVMTEKFQKNFGKHMDQILSKTVGKRFFGWWNKSLTYTNELKKVCGYPTSKRFSKGDRIRVVGLENKGYTKYNGQMGTITGKKSGSSFRWSVTLDRETVPSAPPARSWAQRGARRLVGAGAARRVAPKKLLLKPANVQKPDPCVKVETNVKDPKASPNHRWVFDWRYPGESDNMKHLLPGNKYEMHEM